MRTYYCTFCGKNLAAVLHMIVSKHANICDECTRAAFKIINAEDAANVEYESWIQPRLTP